MKKNNQVKFSIIVPVYNSEKYIQKCIDSILNQTYDNYEIIIINDGSTDNTLKIINSNYKNRSNIIIVNKENQGVSMARNLGIQYAKGEWITFLDADDWIDDNTLKIINQEIESNSEIELIQNNIYISNDYKNSNKYKVLDNLIKKESTQKKEIIETIICINYGSKKYGEKYGNCRCIGGKFYKKSLLIENKIAFPDGMETFEDGIFNLYAYFYSRATLIFNKNLYHYRQHSTSATHQIVNNQFERNSRIISEIINFINNFKMENYMESFYYCCYELLLILLKNNYSKRNYRKYIEKMLKFEFYENSVKNIKYKFLNMKDRIKLFLLRNKLYYLLKCFYLINDNKETHIK
ncbi:MAG: glycosyltransferase family 2 protein [Candidatus Scatovivens sp.]